MMYLSIKAIYQKTLESSRWKWIACALSTALLILTFQNCSGSFSSISTVSSGTLDFASTNMIPREGFSANTYDRTIHIGETTYFDAFPRFYGYRGWESTLSYTWYRNGQVIPNQNKSSLTINNATLPDQGNYSVDVKITESENSDFPNGTLSFQMGKLTVRANEQPLITYPSSKSITALYTYYTGESFNYSITASGGDIAYRLFKDGVLLKDSSKSGAFFLENLSKVDSGRYKAEASNSAGSTAVEFNILVKDTELPTFPTLFQPETPETAVFAGNSFSIYGARAFGGGVQYRWYKDEVLLKPSSTLTFNSSNLYKQGSVKSDAGVYRLEAYNSIGSASISYRVLIKDPTAPTAPIILNDSPTNVTAYIGTTFTLKIAIAAGAGDLTYRWFKDGVSLANTSYAETFKAEKIADSGVYKVEAKNALGSVSKEFIVVVKPIDLPVFSNVTMLLKQYVGDNVYLRSELATGSNVKYRWYKDSKLIPYVNDNYLIINQAAKSNSGQYKLEAYNSAGRAFVEISLEIIDPRVPIFLGSLITGNRSIYVGDPLTIVAPKASGGLVKFRWYKNEVLITNEESNLFKKSSISSEDAGIYKIEAYNPAGSSFLTSTLVVKQLTLPAYSATSLPDRNCFEGGPCGIGLPTATGGRLNYRIYKDDAQIYDLVSFNSVKQSDSGIYKFEAYNSVGSAFISAKLIVNSPVVPIFDLKKLTDINIYVGQEILFSNNNASGGGGIRYRWYKNDAVLEIQTGNSFQKYPAISSDAGVYKLEAYNEVGSAFVSGTVTIRDYTTPTFALPSLADRTVYAGEKFAFDAGGVTGGGIEYRWFKNNVLLQDVTSRVLSKDVATKDDSGIYKVEAYNSVGVAYLSANLTILDQVAPTLSRTRLGAYAVYYVGDTLGLVGGIASGGAVKYRWYKDNVLIPGSIGDTYVKTLTATTDSGVYKCEAYNSVGSATLEAVVNVSNQIIPIIILNSSTTTTRVGGTITMDVSAKGGSPIVFKWLKDGIPFTSNIYFGRQYLKNQNTLSDAGLYRVEASNSAGTSFLEFKVIVNP